MNGTNLFTPKSTKKANTEKCFEILFCNRNLIPKIWMTSNYVVCLRHI